MEPVNLSGLSRQRLENFFSKFRTLNFARRDTILYAEDDLFNVYYIQEGYVRVYRISEQGEELTLNILGPQDFFPITCVSVNIPNNYYLEAITSLKIKKVSQELFITYVKNNPDLFYELTNYILARFGGLLSRLEYLVLGNAYRKVATIIMACSKRFGEKQGKNIILGLPLTHRDIAALVGITRETACLEIRKLEKKGLISHKGRYLVIKNPKGLEEESLYGFKEDNLLNSSI